MKKLLVPITFTVCSISSLATAAPNDAFLQANQLNDQGNKLNLDLAVDAVNETIDIFNIRGGEAAAVDNAGDYFGGHIHGTYQLNPSLALEAGFWQREIDYSQDTNDIQSWLVAARYTPPFDLKKNNYFDLRLSAWGNQANELNKSTPTAVNGRTINTIQVNDPSDLQFQADAIFSKKLDPMNQLNAFASLGYSKVDISGLNLQTTYQNCLMNLNVQTNNQVTGNLAQPCRIDGVTLTDLSVQFDANEIGFDAQKDMNYDAYFASFGGSWNWRYKKFESQLAYQYQRLWRSDIDDRVNSFGQSPVKDNHTFSARLAYDVHPNVSAFLEGHLFKRNFIGTVPFLYNGVTASRLDRKYGYASLGLNLRF